MENDKQLDFSSEFDELINAEGRITPSILTAVNRYFLYFSFFESLLLNCAGSQWKSEKYAKRLLQMGIVDMGVLKRTYMFFSDRYLNDRSKFESLCGELQHTSQRARDDHFSSMQAMTGDPTVQLGVCLFVCFRLRNNLFHGPKWRYFLEGQEELLLFAGDLIHSILSHVPKQDGWAFQNILDSND
ncbi:hypothetical protein [Citrobacter braakii]|nr:hypothetical protein [Citrobacter braakii]OPB23644.1 hypothetical protein BFW94_12550 [Enterobacter ludwigii]WFW80672.1 hypothetical protein NFJ84_13270 [Citrobacter braakii]